jgi:hypothetical protein
MRGGIGMRKSPTDGGFALPLPGGIPNDQRRINRENGVRRCALIDRFEDLVRLQGFEHPNQLDVRIVALEDR